MGPRYSGKFISAEFCGEQDIAHMCLRYSGICNQQLLTAEKIFSPFPLAKSSNFSATLAAERGIIKIPHFLAAVEILNSAAIRC